MSEHDFELLIVIHDAHRAGLLEARIQEAWRGPIVIHRVERLTHAIEWLEHHRPACIMLDLSLPDAAGLGAVLKLRASAPSIPIIVADALDNDDLAAAAVQAGAQDFVPIDVNDARSLTRAIRYAIARSEAEAMLTDQAKVLESIASGAPLDRTLSMLREMIDRSMYAVRSVLVTLDGGAVEALDTPTVEAGLLELLNAQPVALDHPLGAAIIHRQLAVVTDLELDPAWSAHRRMNDLRNIGAAWTVPIRGTESLSAPSDHANDVIGALLVLCDASRRPTLDEQRLLDLVVHLAAIAIERSRTQARLSHQAMYDSLTGLANRSLFVARLEKALAGLRRRELRNDPAASGDSSGHLEGMESDADGRRVLQLEEARARRSRRADGEATPIGVAVFFVDLDGFKAVNDTYGHRAGDELLSRVAERLRGMIRPTDLVARYGGDEFLILCDLDQRSDARRIARRLRRALDGEPFALANHRVRVGASIGHAVSQSGSHTSEELIRAADAAMYASKETRKAERRATAAKSVQVGRDQELKALREAVDLARRGHPRSGLSIRLQPITSVHDHHVAGLAAVTTWVTPSGQIISGDELQSLAEAASAAEDLDWFSIQRSLELLVDVRAGRSHHASVVQPFVHPVTLCVPVGVTLLSDIGIADEISDLLDSCGMRPGTLCLEIPEPVLASADGGVEHSMRELRNAGVHLTVSGVGASSLPLTRLALIDCLKLDPMFAAGLFHPADTQAITQGLIDLAHAIDVVTVVSGVRNAAQVSRLREIGCDYVQMAMIDLAVDDRDTDDGNVEDGASPSNRDLPAVIDLVAAGRPSNRRALLRGRRRSQISTEGSRMSLEMADRPDRDSGDSDVDHSPHRGDSHDERDASTQEALRLFEPTRR